MNVLTLWFHRLSSPPIFYRFAGRVLPWLVGLCIASFAIGLYGGLVLAPPDYQQGDGFRIIFIHVPSAWMSLFIYVCMAAAATVALVWHTKIAEWSVLACAPIGAMFTAITLITGSLWGKPMWGTYWAWDARLTSELILLFLYLGVIALPHAISDARVGARSAALLSIIGLINIPIIHFSVQWWSSLHQGSTIRLIGPSSIDGSMKWPLLTMALATKLYFMVMLLIRLRTIILEREAGKAWVRDLPELQRR